MKMSDEVQGIVNKYAEQRNITVEEAVEKLILVARHRLDATDKYASKQRGEKSPRKAKKAGGPLARKLKA